jgi:DNA repair protein RadC
MTVGRTYSARVPSAALTVSFHVSQARSGHLPFISSTRLAKPAALAPSCSFRRPLRLAFASKRKNMPQQFFSFESELQNTTTEPSSSHCSSVQERLVTYGSEALDSSEHLGVVLGSQKDANALLQHFGSLAILAQASVQQLLPFISRSKAIRLVSSLRMGAVTLREERQSITIDSPEIVAELCSEMRFLDRELLRVVLLNAKQHLIKVVTVSQGTVNESLAHPREIFKPVITHSAYSFVMVHNHPSGDATPSEADIRLTRRINEASRILDLKFMDHVIIGTPAPGRTPYFSFKEGGVIG